MIVILVTQAKTQLFPTTHTSILFNFLFLFETIIYSIVLEFVVTGYNDLVYISYFSGDVAQW